MDFSLRFGQADDTPVISAFILEAGAGIFEHLFSKLIPGVSATDVVRMAVTDENSNLHFSNALLAVGDQSIVGMMLGYSAADFGLPRTLEALIPNKRLSNLDALFKSRIDGTWYLNTLAVADHARRRGVAKLLLECALEMVEEQGFSGTSLHVWEDNAAVSLYREFGFEVVDHVPVAPSEHLRHEGGMLLMHKPFIGHG